MDGRDDINDPITIEQAYRAMLVFLGREADLTESSDLADLLAEYAVDDTGQPRDPAVWDEWLDAVGQAVKGRRAGDAGGDHPALE